MGSFSDSCMIIIPNNLYRHKKSSIDFNTTLRPFGENSPGDWESLAFYISTSNLNIQYCFWGKCLWFKMEISKISCEVIKKGLVAFVCILAWIANGFSFLLILQGLYSNIKIPTLCWLECTCTLCWSPHRLLKWISRSGKYQENASYLSMSRQHLNFFRPLIG